MFNGAFTVNSNLMHSPNFVGRFPLLNQKLHVQNSYTSYRLSNQTPREWMIRVYEIKSKKNASYVSTSAGSQEWLWNGAVFTGSADLQAIGVPEGEWGNALTGDAVNNAVSTSLGSYGIVPKEQFGLSPTSSPSMKAKFQVNLLKSLKIEPGQEANVFLQGPKNLEIDMEKVVENTVYNNIQKSYTRGLIWVMVPDIVHGATSGFGHQKGTVGGIAMERTDTFTITCPDQAAVTNIKDVYIRDVIAGPALVGAVSGVSNDNFVAC
jgi:hypothetical protein